MPFPPACAAGAASRKRTTAGRQGDQGLASAVYNQSALLASDLGLPDGAGGQGSVPGAGRSAPRWRSPRLPPGSPNTPAGEFAAQRAGTIPAGGGMVPARTTRAGAEGTRAQRRGTTSGLRGVPIEPGGRLRAQRQLATVGVASGRRDVPGEVRGEDCPPVAQAPSAARSRDQRVAQAHRIAAVAPVRRGYRASASAYDRTRPASDNEPSRHRTESIEGASDPDRRGRWTVRPPRPGTPVSPQPHGRWSRAGVRQEHPWRAVERPRSREEQGHGVRGLRARPRSAPPRRRRHRRSRGRPPGGSLRAAADTGSIQLDWLTARARSPARPLHRPRPARRRTGGGRCRDPSG